MTTALDRVRKLIALTASPNENEARNAAMLACKLIREHKLDVVSTSAAPSAQAAPSTPESPRATTPADWNNWVQEVFSQWRTTGYVGHQGRAREPEPKEYGGPVGPSHRRSTVVCRTCRDAGEVAVGAYRIQCPDCMVVNWSTNAVTDVCRICWGKRKVWGYDGVLGPCSECSGFGSAPRAARPSKPEEPTKPTRRCDECGGAGVTYETAFPSPCEACDGTGEWRDKPKKSESRPGWSEPMAYFGFFGENPLCPKCGFVCKPGDRVRVRIADRFIAHTECVA